MGRELQVRVTMVLVDMDERKQGVQYQTHLLFPVGEDGYLTSSLRRGDEDPAAFEADFFAARMEIARRSAAKKLRAVIEAGASLPLGS